MSATRLYASLALAIVVCVILSSGAAWGISSVVLAGHSSHSATGPSGKNGADGGDGSTGKDGSPGAAGATGATGATGAKGATGPANGPKGDTGASGVNGTNGINGTGGTNGTNGAPGPQGDKGIQGDPGAQGIPGAAGASAPTFSATPADGTFLVQPSTSSPIATLFGPIPAGPALIGFSMQLTTQFIGVTVSCELTDITTGNVLILGTPTVLSPGSNSLFAGTQVTSLAVASSLQVLCTSPNVFEFVDYSAVSIYAISFAT